MFKCEFCHKEWKVKKAKISHSLRCLKNSKRIKINGRNQFSKAKELNLPVPVHIRKGTFGHQGCVHSEDFKKAQRERAIKRNLGGVTQSRWIRFKGKTLGSTYEHSLVLDLEKNGIKWNTCKKFYYFDNKGKRRSYTPDIYLEEYNVFLDPKNDFLINNMNPRLGFSDLEKIKWVQEQNGIRVIVLDKNQLTWDYISSII